MNRPRDNLADADLLQGRRMELDNALDAALPEEWPAILQDLTTVERQILCLMQRHRRRMLGCAPTERIFAVFVRPRFPILEGDAREMSRLDLRRAERLGRLRNAPPGRWAAILEDLDRAERRSLEIGQAGRVRQMIEHLRHRAEDVPAELERSLG